jgi:hypothetical protein
MKLLVNAALASAAFRRRTLSLNVTFGAHVGSLTILSRHRCRHSPGREVRAYEDSDLSRPHVRRMAILRPAALSGLQIAHQEKSVKLVAPSGNNLPQMRTRSNETFVGLICRTINHRIQNDR